MGLIDQLDSLDLSDEVKDQIRREHEKEIADQTTENAVLRAKARRTDVDQEVAKLSDMGFKEAPGLLKFVRRVLLSDDSEPGLVMLSDDELNLSGDDATGATTKEDISVAGAIRQFIELMPSKDGKIALSDQVLAENAGDPPADGDDNDGDTEGAKKRLGALTGHTAPRTRKRYAGGLHVAGGDN